MGHPRGVLLGLLLVSVMINDIFVNIPEGIGRSPFADDGALWKRGRNVGHAVDKIQERV